MAQRTWFAVPVVVVAIAFLSIAVAFPALASDYHHECQSADGRYKIFDGSLYRASDPEQKNRLVYAILERQTLKLEEGYCRSKHPDAKGQRFGFNSETYRMLVEIDEAHGPITAEMRCELGASGLPAAYACDESITTKSVKQPLPTQSYRRGAPGTWDHNGSVMRLEAEGAERRFYYMNPRPGIRKVGVSGDTLLFEGRREGNRYDGTARIFNAKCGSKTYAVSGIVSDGDTRVVLKGQAPILDEATCEVIRHRPDELVFTRQR